MQNKFIGKILRWIQNPFVSVAIIVFLTFAAYSNIFDNDFIMDDFDYIVDWPLIQDLSNLPKFFVGYTPPNGQGGIFSPFKTLVHALNYNFFGLNVLGHHIFSLVGYLIAIILIYKISYFFLKKRFETFLCTLLFALHPVHVEYVTSMTGSVDAVGVMFLFISFYFYINIQEKSETSSKVSGKKLYVASLIFAFLSIFLHELCIVLPIMFLWYDFCFRKKEVFSTKEIKRIVPYFAMSLVYAVAKLITLGTVTRGKYLYDSFSLTMFVAIKAFAKYVYISFLPITLTHNHVISKGIYSFAQSDFDRVAVLNQSVFEPQVFLSLVVLGVICYFAVKMYKSRPLITFCIGWFFIGLLPGSNIIPSGVYFAERYLYAGSLGFCLLFGLYFAKLFEGEESILKIKKSYIATVLLIVIVLFCIFRIRIRNDEAQSEISIYESAVRANPQSALMKTDLGIVYTKKKMQDKALMILNEAVLIREDDPDIYFAFYNAYSLSEDYEKAASSLVKAIKLNPEFAEAYYNLAGIYAYQGKRSEAETSLNRAVDLYKKRGKIHQAQQIEKAFRDYFKLN